MAQLQDMANNSPQVHQAVQLQRITGNHSAQQQQPTQKKENNTGLPDNLKSGIENLSGYSMDDMKVHRNSDKPAQLQAHAYAQGTDIHLGPGQEKHLPHEVWHVAQQKQGRVKPTMQMKGKVNVNDDAGLEKEADIMGAKALQMKPNENVSSADRMESRVVANSVGQKNSDDKEGFGFMDNRNKIIQNEQKSSFEREPNVKRNAVYGNQVSVLHQEAKRYHGVVVQRANDPIEVEALKSRDLAKVTDDVNHAMPKIIDKLNTLASNDKKVSSALAKTGRDAWVYFGIYNAFKKKRSLLTLANSWSNKWKLEYTCGLLLDIGNAVRKSLPDIPKMTKVMTKSRGKNHKVEKKSDWAKELPTGSKVQAGVSATTHNLIRTLLALEATEWREIEAILIGIVKYWKEGSKIKTIRGEFHTAAEVWSAYQHQLFEWYEAKNRNTERNADGALKNPVTIDSSDIAKL